MRDEREIQSLLQKGLKELQSMKVCGNQGVGRVGRRPFTNFSCAETNCYQPVLPDGPLGGGGRGIGAFIILSLGDNT